MKLFCATSSALQFPKPFVFLVFIIPDDGQIPKSQCIPSVRQHRQKPVLYASYSWFCYFASVRQLQSGQPEYRLKTKALSYGA
jgi:hypothetical protein